MYAGTGAGKSTFAATFPKPAIALVFDRRGKIWPYTTLPDGMPRGIEMPEYEGAHGQSIIEVRSRKNNDKKLVQIEMFEDEIVEQTEPTEREAKLEGRTPFGGIQPRAARRYLARCPTLFQEVRDGVWKTVIVDSLTYMKIAFHSMHRFDLNKLSQDDRRWDKLTTDDLEQALCNRLTTLRCNLVLLAHTDRRGENADPKEKVKSHKDKVAGVAVYQPFAPGRLNTADALPSAFPEFYAIQTSRDGDNVVRTLQTELDARYNCNSAIKAPNGLVLDGVNDYKMLWLPYDARMKKAAEASE